MYLSVFSMTPQQNIWLIYYAYDKMVASKMLECTARSNPQGYFALVSSIFRKHSKQVHITIMMHTAIHRLCGVLPAQIIKYNSGRH